MKTQSKLILILIAMGCFVLGVSKSHAQDVYNFYFNKNNNGQKAMIQNGDGTSQEVTAPAVTPAKVPLAPATPAVEATPMQKIADSFKTWEISVGSSFARGYGDYYEWGPDELDDEDSYTEEAYEAEGISVYASKYFNKYIGTDLGLSFLELKNMKNNDSFIQAKLGIVVTPLRLNIFGHDFLELSAVGGFSNFKQLRVKYNENGENGSIIDEVDVVRPYLGIRAAFNFTDQIALVSEAISASEDDYDTYSGNVSLRYRF